MKNKEAVKIMVFNCMTMIRVIVFLSSLLIGIGLFTSVDKMGMYKNYFSMESPYKFTAIITLMAIIVLVVMSIVDSLQIGHALTENVVGVLIVICSYIMTGKAKEELEYSYFYFKGMGSSYNLLRIFSVVILLVVILRMLFLFWYIALENGVDKHEENRARVICDSCGKNYESDRKSCPYCGSKEIRGYLQSQLPVSQNTIDSARINNNESEIQQWFCPYCGTPNKSGIFCIKCGKQKP